MARPLPRNDARIGLALRARFPYCANQCRKRAKPRSLFVRAIFGRKSALSPTTMPRGMLFHTIFMIATNWSMHRRA